MAIFDPVPAEQMGTLYTHRGWFAFCPIYVARLHTPKPKLIARNGVPDWLLDAAVLFQQLSMLIIVLVDPAWEPGFMIRVTSPIEPR